MAHDLVIAGGTIVDGTGAERFAGDVAIDDGRIAAVGGRLDGERTIDADGAVVTPGWVDVHTHYDGQATWDDELDPSFGNGVTTLGDGQLRRRLRALPARRAVDADRADGRRRGHPRDRAARRRAVGRVGELPRVPRLPRFPRVTRSISRRSSRTVPCVSRSCATAGSNNEDATADDIAAMRRLVAEATAAGAVGFSTSRTIFHRSIGGGAVPGTYASDVELRELVQGMADGGGGVFEAITSSSLGQMTQLGGERFSQEHELRLLADISRATGQKITFTTVQHGDDPQAWRAVLDFAVEQNATGAQLYPQIASRPVGILGGLACYHPFMRRPSYLEIARPSDGRAGGTDA